MIENAIHPDGERCVDHDDSPIRDLESSSDGRLYDALSSERRRTALSVIAGASLPLDTATLARAVAAREERVPVEAVPRASFDEVHLALYHVHLPKMADCGLVELDDDGDVEGVIDGFESVW